MVVRVAVNGYGTVGRRVADAVALQKDMKIVGVVKTRPSFEALTAIKNGFPLYVNTKENKKAFDEAGMKVAGTVEDLLEKADVVVDATPDGVGMENRKNLYEPRKIKAIFQGGEEADVAQVSFNATSNYANALGKDFVRVVSCNTTGLCRTIGAIDRKFDTLKVRAVLIRRGPDPANIKKGPVNAIVPDPVTVPSHHGPDVNTVLPDLNITTVALKVPTTLMHMHTINANLNNGTSKEEIVDLLNKTPRVLLVKAKDGLKSTAHIMEWARDLNRTRSDLNEIPVWEESIHVNDGEVFYMQAIHQESDIVPENVDAIRALMGIETDHLKSVKKTDMAMGLKPWWKYS
jgi:glyceraldehyde-3-phosphate dehydrogenase (NAD(P))